MVFNNRITADEPLAKVQEARGAVFDPKKFAIRIIEFFRRRMKAHD
jgi:hypothetical protein